MQPTLANHRPDQSSKDSENKGDGSSDISLTNQSVPPPDLRVMLDTVSQTDQQNMPAPVMSSNADEVASSPKVQHSIADEMAATEARNIPIKGLEQAVSNDWSRDSMEDDLQSTSQFLEYSQQELEDLSRMQLQEL